MPDTPPPHHSPPNEPLISNPNPNSNPNNITATEIDPSEKSQPSNPEIENPLQKSPINDPVKNPDQEIQLNEQIQVLDEDDLEQEQEQEQEEQDHEDEEEGINMMPISPLSQFLGAKMNSSKLCVRRKKKGKKGFTKKSIVAFQKKMQDLSETFKPIPFVPEKVLDFLRHEESLKKLGLWDFAHIEFDKVIRVDLLMQLIVNYGQKTRVSYVNDVRLKVNRADLARALKLPVKKPAGDYEGDSFSTEFLLFLEQFVSNWMLLHESEMWVMPTEIVNLLNSIKEGQPHKIDWAGLIWSMMEKELAQGTNLKECYYVSHMQRLIKEQREDLLKEMPEMVIEDLADPVKDDEGGDVNMLDAEESRLGEEKLEEKSIELHLGQDFVTLVEKDEASCLEGQDGDTETPQKDGDVDMVDKDEDADTFEKVDDVDKMENEDIAGSMVCLNESDIVGNVGSAESAEHAENFQELSKDMGDQLFMDGRSDGFQFTLQPCNMAGEKLSTENAGPYGGVEVKKDEEGEDERHVQGMKSTMDGLGHLQFGTGQLPYGSSEIGGSSTLGLMPTRVENDIMFDGSSMFNHAGKREIDFVPDFSHHSVDQNHKRMRVDGQWAEKPPDFDMCVDQVIQWAGKLKSSHQTMDALYHNQANVIQSYSQQLVEKEGELLQLKYKFDELQRRRNAEVSRRDRELHLMNSAVDGYRRALKETQRKFAEYRKRYHVRDEPIYKDTGSGGVVKSIMELERERLKKEEEQRKFCFLLEDEFNKYLTHFESEYEEMVGHFDEYDVRLEYATEELKLLRDRIVKSNTKGNVMISEDNPYGNVQNDDMQCSDAQDEDVQIEGGQNDDIKNDDYQIEDVHNAIAQNDNGQINGAQKDNGQIDGAQKDNGQIDGALIDDAQGEDLPNDDSQNDAVQKESAHRLKEQVSNDYAQSEGVQNDNPESKDVQNESSESKDVQNDNAKNKDVQNESSKSKDVQNDNAESKDVQNEGAQDEIAQSETVQNDERGPSES